MRRGPGENRIPTVQSALQTPFQGLQLAQLLFELAQFFLRATAYPLARLASAISFVQKTGEIVQ